MRNIHFTKEGRRFSIAVVLIGFASLNTGNNLIYLLFSMMLALSLVSFIIALVNLRGLDCVVNFREPVYAHIPVKIDIATDNRKFFSSYSVSLVFPVSMSRQLFFPALKPGASKWSFTDVVINRRGRFFLKDFRLSTGFPFIFMYVSKTIACNKELIVYPHIVDVSSLLPGMQPQISDEETLRRGQEGDFLFSREYVYGEESRNIDWKATAKTQKTMVKEYSSPAERFATIIFDNGGRAEEDAFEKAVSITASICAEFIEREYYVRLITCGKVVPFGNGKVHLFKVLDILAAVQEAKGMECLIGETIEGLSILVTCSDTSGFSGIAPLCSGVVDARNI